MIKTSAFELKNPALLSGNQRSTVYLPFVKQAVPNDAEFAELINFPTRLHGLLTSSNVTSLSHE